MSDASADTPLLRAIDGRGIATLTFNRPDKGNSYNGAMLDALLDSFARLGADPAVRAIVLRGAGKHFCLGAEIGGGQAATTAKPRPTMPDLLLKRIGRRGEEHYDVLADGTEVGRIMMFADTPAGKPWMWSLAYGQHEDRTPTHGYEPTREAAMQAFARSWNRNGCPRRGKASEP